MKGLSKKMGPLPVWAWGLIFGVVGYYLYERHLSSSASNTSTASTAQVLDPNAIDPNTGLTYGQEEDAALNANAAQLAGSGGSGTSPTDSSLSTQPSDLQTGTSELGDLSTFLSGFSQIARQLGYTAPGALSPGVPTPITSSGPGIVATANTNPAVWDTSTMAQQAQAALANKRPVTTPKSALTRGGVPAPFGPTKPVAISGYSVRGLGSGNWEYVPTKKKKK